ncbi:interferon-induced transmembrane protein 1 [Puntigrus tetrazona]|uniref:interferon-induced transmembrane protein 1 n=1 Tax=Puntigrus tetrazona TaxID=1606681 RepID=UPI001C8A9B8A|nr:interferon-induced transmembrane protein 1 [Puntigrus tetrazona]
MAMQNYPAPGESVRQEHAQPVTLSMPDQKVSDDIIFSTFNLHFCNPCCIGFGAFYNSIKARDSRLLGDIPLARSYGSRARKLNIAAAILGSVSLLIFIIIVAKFSSVPSSH